MLETLKASCREQYLAIMNDMALGVEPDGEQLSRVLAVLGKTTQTLLDDVQVLKDREYYVQDRESALEARKLVVAGQAELDEMQKCRAELIADANRRIVELDKEWVAKNNQVMRARALADERIEEAARYLRCAKLSVE